MAVAYPSGEPVLQYAVLQFANEWRIVCKGWKAGRFPTRQDAVCAAERLAREAQALGSAVEFLVQSPSGEMEACELPQSPWRHACEPDLSVRRRTLADMNRPPRPSGSRNLG